MPSVYAVVFRIQNTRYVTVLSVRYYATQYHVSSVLFDLHSSTVDGRKITN